MADTALPQPCRVAAEQTSPALEPHCHLADFRQAAGAAAGPQQQERALGTTWVLRWLAELALAWPPGLRPLAGKRSSGGSSSSSSSRGGVGIKEQQDAAALWGSTWLCLLQLLGGSTTTAAAAPTWLEEAALGACCALAASCLVPGHQLRAGTLALPQLHRPVLSPAAQALLQAVHDAQPCSSGHDIAATAALLPACLAGTAPAPPSHLHLLAVEAAAMILPVHMLPPVPATPAAPAALLSALAMLGLDSAASDSSSSSSNLLPGSAPGIGSAPAAAACWPHRCWWAPDAEALAVQQQTAQALRGEELAARLLAQQKLLRWQRQWQEVAAAAEDGLQAAELRRKLHALAAPVLQQQLHLVVEAAAAATEEQQQQQQQQAGLMGGLASVPAPHLLCRLLSTAAVAGALGRQMLQGQQPAGQQMQPSTSAQPPQPPAAKLAGSLLQGVAAAIEAAQTLVLQLAGSGSFAAAVLPPLQRLSAALRPAELHAPAQAGRDPLAAGRAALQQVVAAAEQEVKAEVA
jgi:hypothetical protein